MNVHTINLGNAVAGTPQFKDEQDATLQLVQNPQWWIMWPVLPLKRRTKLARDRFGFPEMGYLKATGTDAKMPGPYEVREGVIFMAKDTDPVLATYPTVEELMADGWVVD